MKGGVTVITDMVVMGQQFGETWALWIARVIGATAPEAEFEDVTQLYAVSLSTLRVDPTWLKYQMEGARVRSETTRATLRRIMDMEYRMFQEESASTFKIANGWAQALGGAGVRKDPTTGQEHVVPYTWSESWLDPTSGEIYPYEISGGTRLQ